MKALLILMLTAPPAAAQDMRCDQRAAIIREVSEVEKQRRVGYGITDDGTEIYELFLSENGAWSFLLTATNGLTCIVRYGNNFLVTDDSLAKPNL